MQDLARETKVLEVDDRLSLKELREDVPASPWTFFGSEITPAVGHERSFPPAGGSAP
jgi:hypothetical protein